MRWAKIPVADLSFLMRMDESLLNLTARQTFDGKPDVARIMGGRLNQQLVSCCVHRCICLTRQRARVKWLFLCGEDRHSGAYRAVLRLVWGSGQGISSAWSHNN